MTGTPRNDETIEVGDAHASASTIVAAPRDAWVDALRVAALGLIAWGLAIALPAAEAEHLGGPAIVVALLPLAALALGVLFLARDPGSRVARVSLLIGGPAGLVIALAARRASDAPASWDAATVGAMVIAHLAFVAVAARACSRPPALRQASHQELGPSAALDERPRRRWLRRATLGLTGLGSLAAAVIAPSLGGRAAWIERWDTAAEDAAVVAAVLAGSVGAIGIAALVGPALRAPRGSEAPRQRPVRVAIALGLGLAAAAGFAMLTWLDSSR